MEREKKKMEMQSFSWSDLPIEILQFIIFKLLKLCPNDLQNFRLVCKNWRSSILISTFLPSLTNSLFSEKVISSSIFLIYPTLTSNCQLLMVLAMESTKGNIDFLHPFSRTQILNLPKNLNLNQFQSTHLATAYHIVSPSCCFDKVLLYNNLCPSMDNYHMLYLINGGQLYHSLPFGKNQTRKVFPGNEIVYDVIEYKGDLFSLQRQGLLKLHGKFCIPGRHETLVSHGIMKQKVKAERRNRLVVSSSGEKLYLIVPKDDGYGKKDVRFCFDVYELMKNYTTNSWFWKDVRSFGDDDQVLFFSKDHCFFLAASKFPGCRLKDCIVFSDDAFPLCSKSGWDYGKKGGNEVGVFFLETLYCYSQLGANIPGFPATLCHTQSPNWLSLITSFDLQHKSHLQSESEVVAVMKACTTASTSEFASLQAWPKYVSAPTNVSCPKLVSTLTSVSWPPWPNHVSTPTIEPESEEQITDIPSTSVGPISCFPVSEVRHDEDVIKKEVFNASSALVCTSLMAGENCVPFIEFQGVNVRSNLLPTLQAIWAKHGNLIDKDTVRSRDMLACALESLAKVILILQSTTARTLTDCQAKDLDSILYDLQCARLKVDWLAPIVEKVLKVHKNKPLIESIMDIDKKMAEAHELEKEFLARSAKMQQELVKSRACLTARIPFREPIILDECFGEGLC